MRNGVLMTTSGLSKFPGLTNEYHGKVRDVYYITSRIKKKKIAMIATDRLSAFDVVLPQGIPFKGQVLTQIAEHFLLETKTIVPNWLDAVPHPMLMIGKECVPYKVEMVVRGFLTGSSWKLYKNGGRNLCGIILPEGMKENEKFPTPLLTPTTKADQGTHDENISREEIIASGLVPEDEYIKIEEYALKLFQCGVDMAAEKGLILVDTKYEFGKDFDGNICLIDEIHTPDSSRYWYADSYLENFEKGIQQNQLSKEFVREYLVAHGFEGKEGQEIPVLPDEVIEEISKRYIQLYEIITGKTFVPYLFETEGEVMKKIIPAISTWTAA